MKKMQGTELVAMLDAMVGKEYIFSLGGGFVILEGNLKKEKRFTIDLKVERYSLTDDGKPTFFHVELDREYEVDTFDRPNGMYVCIS